MKYLVTGGAGFIGSNIVDELVKNGEEVRVIDNLSTGKKENLKNCLKDIEFINGDLVNYEVACKITKDVDYVIHQAALPSVPRSIENPIATNLNNVTATVNLLFACVKSNNVKRVVQAGSSSAYGNVQTLPKVESMVPNPRSPYAVSKLAQEYYGMSFFYSYGLEVISLRYFNVFGPNQRADSPYSAVIPKFVDAILNKRSPIIYGDGNTSRDFTYVQNVVNANLLASFCKWPGLPEVINIGTGNNISLNNLIDLLSELTGNYSKPINRKERNGDVKHSLADIEKAKNLLGYVPTIDLESGLKKFLKWKQSKII